MRKSFFMVDNLPPETFIQIAKEYFSCFSHMEILFIHKICTVFYPSFLLYPQSPGFAFLRLFLYNVCIDFNDFRSKITRAKKGHEGVKGTVAEDYQGILVHDHDITFYNYGTDHRECLAHVLRYLKDSMDNEPDRTGIKKCMVWYRKWSTSGIRPGCLVTQTRKRSPDLKNGIWRYLKRPGKNMRTFRQIYMTECPGYLDKENRWL